MFLTQNYLVEFSAGLVLHGLLVAHLKLLAMSGACGSTICSPTTSSMRKLLFRIAVVPQKSCESY